MTVVTSIHPPFDLREIEIEVVTYNDRSWIKATIEGSEIAFHMPTTTPNAKVQAAADALRACYGPRPSVLSAPRMKDFA